MTTNHDFPEDFVELAEEYHDLVVEGSSESEEVHHDQPLEELEQEVESLEEDLEKYDEEHPLYSVLKEEYTEKKEQLENRQTESERVATLEDVFPQRIVSDFIADEDVLNEKVIKAVSHALIGEDRDELLVNGFRLSSDVDLERSSVINITKQVHEIAKHKIGDESEIPIWDSLSDRDKSIMAVLSSAETHLGPTGIADQMEEDVSKGAISPRFTKDKDREYPVFYDGEDGNELSLVGEYIWKTQGYDKEKDFENDEEGDNEEITEEGQLDNFTND